MADSFIIGEIWRYPVASMGGERLEAAQLETTGIDGDRSWAVAGADDGTVAAPDRHSRWQALPSVSARLQGSNAEIDADGTWLAAGSTAAQAWLSARLGFDVRLAPARPADSTQDASTIALRYRHAPVMVATTASLSLVGSLLDDPRQADFRRFRPSLVVDTGKEGFNMPEQAWIGKQVRAGGALLRVEEPCIRCPFVALAQPGLAFDPSVLHAVSHHGERIFGVLCEVVEPGMVRKGDALEILAR